MGINVLIADDQILFADNLKLMLETLTEDIKVVDIAHNGSEATEMSERYKPDIILMDVRMPIKDGVEATKEIKHILPNTKIIMLTMFVDDQYVEDALRNGAEGYLLKNIKPNPINLDIMAQGGYGTFGFYVKLSPFNIMQQNHAPQMRSFSTGVMLHF